ncbi:hypothetical protein HNY73_012178 [Argiope bruennichi]|uniref:Uncharacterized protein n=1 Tax=Argiope bruennichi TaxID=94029 RepID=A0A8T0EU90_ARGBR|nr:hypothetical protein HNY73_012178 [Argiope bruennichi]
MRRTLVKISNAQNRKSRQHQLGDDKGTDVNRLLVEEATPETARPSEQKKLYPPSDADSRQNHLPCEEFKNETIGVESDADTNEDTDESKRFDDFWDILDALESIVGSKDQFDGKGKDD